jgi:hypothetical protein
MLMDTILRGVPMPKIFLANELRNGSTYRTVIDGQQRISAILAFLRDEFSLETPYTGEDKGKKFSELDQDAQDRFLNYQIDFNEANNPSDDEVREVYARVNKYTVPLNKQELRRADFPGDFLSVSEELAVQDFFEEASIFTPAERRRYVDVEYVSELLAALLDGIQDKKTKLDNFYIEYAKWNKNQKEETIRRFKKILDELQLVFDESLHISKTRFRQKADFYSLFLVIDNLLSEGLSLKDKEISFLRQDLKILDLCIRPESDIEICSEYAIKCVSQANSASSRRWRHGFLKSILSGTYKSGSFDDEGAIIFYRLMEGLSAGISRRKAEVSRGENGVVPLYRFLTGGISIGGCTGDWNRPVFKCQICQGNISEEFNECNLAWHRDAAAMQISNSCWIHRDCMDEGTDLFVLRRSEDEPTDLF